MNCIRRSQQVQCWLRWKKQVHRWRVVCGVKQDAERSKWIFKESNIWVNCAHQRECHHSVKMGTRDLTYPASVIKLSNCKAKNSLPTNLNDKKIQCNTIKFIIGKTFPMTSTEQTNPSYRIVIIMQGTLMCEHGDRRHYEHATNHNETDIMYLLYIKCV
jgi:hypothetical protein